MPFNLAPHPSATGGGGSRVLEHQQGSSFPQRKAIAPSIEWNGAFAGTVVGRAQPATPSKAMERLEAQFLSATGQDRRLLTGSDQLGRIGDGLQPRGNASSDRRVHPA